ncbi:MAG TPA: hypothetical protein VLV81_10560 [Acidimicrobiia bacterium]|nr:hypothetical protein [Acidimicrobiia bacterium]
MASPQGARGGETTRADDAQTHEFGHIVALSHEPTGSDSLMYPTTS